MVRYPILFTFTDLVVGHDFLAKVTVDGRALLVQEGEADFWVYGVEPGGIAGGGDTMEACRADFRNGQREVLYDMAYRASTFKEFEAEVQAYFDTFCEATAVEWGAAVQEVRGDRIEDPGLPRQAAESARGVEVVRLVLGPELNEEAILPTLRPASDLAESRLAA
jgi:hypothetical protein